MKSLVALLVLTSGIAHAHTYILPASAGQCPTYCLTDTPAPGDFINIDYNKYLVIGIKGKPYRAANPGYLSTEILPQPSATSHVYLVTTQAPVMVFADDGSGAYATVVLSALKTTITANSGRAHYTITKWQLLSGSVTTP
jgi:hypothetical protein